MSVLGGDFNYSEITRKIAEILAKPDDAGSGIPGFTAYGDNALISATTKQAVKDADGIRTRIATSAVLNNNAQVNGDLQWRRDQFVAGYFKVKLQQITNCRAFFGLSDRFTNMVDSTSITANYFGIQFDSGMESNWKFFRNDNSGSGTRTDTTIAASTNILDFYFWLFATAGGNKIIAQLGHDVDRVLFTSDLPLNTANMGYECSIRALAATAKGIEIGKIFLLQVA